MPTRTESELPSTVMTLAEFVFASLSAVQQAALLRNKEQVQAIVKAYADTADASVEAPEIPGHILARDPLVVEGDGIGEIVDEDVDLRATFIAKGDWEDVYPGIELLTTDEAATRLGITQPTVLAWIKKHKVLALSRSKRGYRIPGETIGADGNPLPGLTQVITQIGEGDHMLAWSFLTFPLLGHAGATPLEFLRAGDLEGCLRQVAVWRDPGLGYSTLGNIG